MSNICVNDDYSPPPFFSIIHLSSRKEQGRSAHVPEEAGNHLALTTHLQSHPSHPPTCTGSGDPPKTPSQPNSRSVHASFSRAWSTVPRYTTKPECPTGSPAAFRRAPAFSQPEAWLGAAQEARLGKRRERNPPATGPSCGNPSDRSAVCWRLKNEAVMGEAHLQNISPTERFISCCDSNMLQAHQDHFLFFFFFFWPFAQVLDARRLRK